MVEILRGSQGPGTWRPLSISSKAGGAARLSATLVCPGCGCAGSLEEHIVQPDGRVIPSVECPFAGCSFHEHVQLLGWSEYIAEADQIPF